MMTQLGKDESRGWGDGLMQTQYCMQNSAQQVGPAQLDMETAGSQPRWQHCRFSATGKGSQDAGLAGACQTSCPEIFIYSQGRVQ